MKKVNVLIIKRINITTAVKTLGHNIANSRKLSSFILMHKRIKQKRQHKCCKKLMKCLNSHLTNSKHVAIKMGYFIKFLSLLAR